MNKEIIIRRSIYNGKAHKLVYTGTGKAWRFSPAEEWMPVSYSYEKDGRIVSLDSDGFGYPLTLGEKIGDKVVEAILDVDDEFIVFLNDINE